MAAVLVGIYRRAFMGSLEIREQQFRPMNVLKWSNNRLLCTTACAKGLPEAQKVDHWINT